MESSAKGSEELLEFSFRRIHDELGPKSKRTLLALAAFSDSQPIEALAAATALSIDDIDDAIDELQEASLIIQNFDRGLNDSIYTIQPITRRFAQEELSKTPGLENDLRRAFQTWRYGTNIYDDKARLATTKIRQGAGDSATILVDAAIEMRQKGKLEGAETTLLQAIQRSPKSWRAPKELGDFYKSEKKTGRAIEYYAKAAANAPKRGKDRALIFREYGILLRDDLSKDALDKSCNALEIALNEIPNDPVTLYVLGQVYCRRGMNTKALPHLLALLDAANPEGRKKAYPLLKRCLHSGSSPMVTATVKDKARKDGYAW